MVLVWMAILIVVFIAIVALAVDWGYAYWTSQKLQNAADAAALAGARQVAFRHDDARAQAIAIASQNEAGGVMIALNDNADNAASGDIIIGHYDAATRAFVADDSSDANAVAVNARLTADSENGSLGLIWGPIFGQDSTQITRWAIAVVEGGPAGDSVIALDPDDKQSFYMHGTPTLDLGSGTVQVNSDHNEAVRMGGNSVNLIGSAVNLQGGYKHAGYDPPPELDFNTGRPPVADPLADRPEPNPDSYTRYDTIASSGTFNPGYYPNGLDLRAGHNVTLNPGVYIFDNGFKINGHANLTGYEVLIFIRTGVFVHNGTGDTILTPPPVDDDPNTYYDGIQFFQSRSNTSVAKFNGTGLMTGMSNEEGVGTLYFPSSRLELGGTGNAFHVNSLIARNIEVYGTGFIQVTRGYDSTTSGDKVYLAE